MPPEPADVDIVHTAALEASSLDGVGCLLLGADETARCRSAAATSRTNMYASSNFLIGLLQIDDIDTVSLSEDVLGHFGVPSSGVVSEMDAGFKQLLD